MEPENNLKLIDRMNHSTAFLQRHNMTITEAWEGHARVEMTIDESMLNVFHIVHGGILFSLADTAAGTASFATGRESVTLNASINFIKPATGKKITAIATEISRGHTIGNYEVFLFNEDETIISRATLTMYFLKKKEEK